MEPWEMDDGTLEDGPRNPGRWTMEPWEMDDGTLGDGPWNSGR